MLRRRIFAVLFALAGYDSLALAVPSYGLRASESCRALEEMLENRALEALREDARWVVLGPMQRNQGEDGPANFTTTNLQTEGVDEGDVVKNNATSIFAIEGQNVVVMRSWPPEKLSIVARIPVSGSPREMLLDGKGRLLVASDTDASKPADAVPLRDFGATVVSIYDVSQLSKPTLLREYKVPGHFRGLRRIGPRVLALADEGFWNRWEWLRRMVGDYKPTEDEGVLQRRIEAVMRKVTPVVKSYSISQWLGRLALRKGNAWVEAPVTEETCRSVLVSPNSPHLGLDRVLALDLDSNTAPRVTAILGGMEGFYASPEALWFTELNPAWDEDKEEWTYLHRFDSRRGGRLAYDVSGRVEGRTVNTFAFDEHEGHLRVATTISDVENAGRDTVNRVSVLRREGRELRVVGQTPDFEKGESIYSVRFAGDKGFVVTFRQVDPLLTLDLAEPTAPRIVGELKVPGFSTYIHLVDKNHLLTVGRHVPLPLPDGSASPEPSAMKVSLFDVSDFSRPQEVHSLVLPAGIWSDAYWDHRAFTYFPAREVLALPVSAWRPSADSGAEFHSSLMLFDVAVERGISSRGELPMSDVQFTHRYEGGEWTQRAYVHRSILADDYVYALSDLGVRVSHLQSLATPLATVTFEP